MARSLEPGHPLQTAWDSYQTYMIPSAAQQPTNAGYNPSLSGYLLPNVR
jgi:hypothetical protein